MRMLGMGGSKKGLSVEKMKAEIVEELSRQTAVATTRLKEVTADIANLRQTIDDAEDRRITVELKLRQLQEQAVPDKNTIDTINGCVLELQTFDQTIRGWNGRVEALKEERTKLLGNVKNEVARVFGGVKKAIQVEVDARAGEVLKFLVEAEAALRECHMVELYVPGLERLNEVRPSTGYHMFCPPTQLAGYLRKMLPSASPSDYTGGK